MTSRTQYHLFILVSIVTTLLLLMNSAVAQSQKYYVDATNGNDNNTGKGIDLAWKSLDKVNNTTFAPADTILFKTGEVWNGQLLLKGSGSRGKPIIVSSYGNDTLPRIDGGGLVTNVISLSNQEYLDISHLELTNNVLVSDTVMRRGIYIRAQDFSIVHNIHLSHLFIHDVKGDINDKNSGGIYVEIVGSARTTRFDSLIIEDCKFLNVDRTGVSTNSSWATRTLTTNTNWAPSAHVIFRNNWFERTGGNGLILRVATSPLIEHNVFKQCGLKTTGNAVFPFNCDDALIQYNEAYLTVNNSGDVDASGFDSDYRCKRSIFQYNYSHDNEGGFMVITCEGGDGKFNDSTIVRYNISQNDGGEIIHLSGQTTNTFVYNNVVYSGISNSFRRIIDGVAWSGAYPDSTNFFNNVFFIMKTPSYYFSNSTNTVFSNNVFYGIHSSSEPSDPAKIILDPMFVNPGTASIGFESLTGYQLKAGSPCIDAGIHMNNHAIKDFWGNIIPADHVDRGANEFTGTDAVNEDGKRIPTGFRLEQNYPNPFNPTTWIEYALPEASDVRLSIVNLYGQELTTLVNSHQQADTYRIEFDATRYASGVYFYSLTAGGMKIQRKMVLVK